MNLCADRLIPIVIVESFKREMHNLREWYFYKPEHSDFNAFYYEFLEAVNKPHLSLEEQVELCYTYFTKAVAYMNTYYPDVRQDVDLLSQDMDNPFYPEILAVPPSLPSQRKTKKKTTAGKAKKTGTGKTRGRPKGSKNKKKVK